MTKWARSLFVIVGAIASSGPRAAIAALADAATTSSPAPTRPTPNTAKGTTRDGDFLEISQKLSCYRRQETWLRVALMQVNGEGTPADLAAARASLDRLAFKDADVLALEKIIKKRKAGPLAKSRRVEFCKDVASTTVSRNFCQARAGEEKAHKNDAQLQKIKADLDPRLFPALDRAQAAFTRFVKAEGDRVYQENIDGSIRDHEAWRKRPAFGVTSWHRQAAGDWPRGAPRGTEIFPEADRELNSVYNTTVSRYVSYNERAAKDALATNAPDMVAEYLGRNTDYKTKSRAAQHEWVRYRNAMGELAAGRWPEASAPKTWRAPS